MSLFFHPRICHIGALLGVLAVLVMTSPVKAGELDIRADSIYFAAENNTYIAEGQVKVVLDQRVLLADRIEYEQNTGMIFAVGQVQYRHIDGSIIYADEMRISETLEVENFVNFRAETTEKARIAANSVVKNDEKFRKFDQFVYTRCTRCQEKPHEPPIWQIEADEAVHDLENRNYIANNAVLRMAGWPVLYTPYFRIPDSTVERTSGFLRPSIGSVKSGSDSERFVVTPYFVDLSLDKNLLINPALTSDGGKLVDLQYHQALDAGSLKAKVSYGTLKLQGDKTPREVGHYEINAALNSQPNVEFGGNFRHTSNPGYLAKNPILTSDFTLLYSSDAYWRRYGFFQPRDLIEVTAIGFKDHRTNVNTDKAPSLVPELRGQFYSKTDQYSGRFRGGFSLRQINQSAFATTQSFHADTEYRIGMIHPFGIVGHYSAKADISHFRYDSHREGLSSGNKTLLFPRVHGSLRLPFQRQFEDSIGVFEPILTLSLTPGSVNSNQIPNQDAGVLSSSEALFSSSEKYSGITRRDDSNRLSVATEYSQFWETGTKASVLVGRSFELSTSSITDASLNRFEKRDNDYILRARLQHRAGLFFENRFAIDNENNHRINSHEFDFSWQNMIWDMTPYANYSFHRRDAQTSLGGRENLDIGLTKKISQYWDFSASAHFDLQRTNNKLRNGKIRLYYQDDCIKMEFYSKHDNATSRFVDKQSTYGTTLELIF